MVHDAYDRVCICKYMCMCMSYLAHTLQIQFVDATNNQGTSRDIFVNFEARCLAVFFWIPRKHNTCVCVCHISLADARFAYCSVL